MGRGAYGVVDVAGLEDMDGKEVVKETLHGRKLGGVMQRRRALHAVDCRDVALPLGLGECPPATCQPPSSLTWCSGATHHSLRTWMSLSPHPPFPSRLTFAACASSEACVASSFREARASPESISGCEKSSSVWAAAPRTVVTAQKSQRRRFVAAIASVLSYTLFRNKAIRAKSRGSLKEEERSIKGPGREG